MADENEDSRLIPLKTKEGLSGDVKLWLGGMLFLGAVLGSIFGIGAARSWDARSGYTYNESATTQSRFLPEPFSPEPGVYKRSDEFAWQRWYYWKLRPDLVTPWTRIFPWVCYVLHNSFVWYVLYQAQRAKTFLVSPQPRYSSSVNKYNYWLLGINAFFHLMHLVNTHITYDGTAQDVSVGSSQSSVIVLLVFIIILAFKERGIALGYPSAQSIARWRYDARALWVLPTDMVRKYHGYGFAWAAIYTFWYHPMENTIGHAFGFSHTWMLMLQGCLIFTKLHQNSYWRLVLETWVCIRGGIVAWQTSSGDPAQETWTLFVFGLLLIYSITSVFGLAFWKNISAYWRIIPLIAYTAAALGVYGGLLNNWARLTEILGNPGLFYGLFIIGWLLLVIMLKIERSFKWPNEDSVEFSSILNTVFWLTLVVVLYATMVLVSFLLEFNDWKVAGLTLTFVFSAIFSVCILVAMMFFKQVIPLHSLLRLKTES